MINKDVLVRLDKLEPYLNDLQEKVVKLFILKENLAIIEKNFDRFLAFEQTFVLLKNNYQAINDVKAMEDVLIAKIQHAIQHQTHIQSFLSA